MKVLIFFYKTKNTITSKESNLIGVGKKYCYFDNNGKKSRMLNDRILEVFAGPTGSISNLADVIREGSRYPDQTVYKLAHKLYLNFLISPDQF